MKNFKVGKPLISYLSEVFFSSLASISANKILPPNFLIDSAAFEYSGANFLQCPHPKKT